VNTSRKLSTRVVLEIVRSYRRDFLIDFARTLFSARTGPRLTIELDWILCNLGINPREAGVLILLQLRQPHPMLERELAGYFEEGVPQLHRVLRRMTASGTVRLHPQATDLGGPSVAITEAGREAALRCLLLYVWGLEGVRAQLPLDIRLEIDALCASVAHAVGNMFSNDTSESTGPASEFTLAASTP